MQAPVTKRLGDPPSELTDAKHAIRNFKRLGRAEQLQLAHEIALTRQVELCLAYDNLINVGSGYRTRRDPAAGNPRLVREVCVTFVVKRKWRTPGRAGDPQALPRHLFGFATLRDQRVLCAVPTDVRVQREFEGAVAREGAIPHPFGLLVDPGPGFEDFVVGVGTCAIKRPTDPGSTFLMSCRHVLGCSSVATNSSQTALAVAVDSVAETPLGKTLGIRGRLASGGTSFDAQLASVTDKEALARAFQSLKFDAEDSFIKKSGDVDKPQFWIATGRRAPNGGRLLVRVTYHGTLPNQPVTYTIGGQDMTIVHDRVLYGESESLLIDGDSGSPAVRQSGGQRLLGMFIASAGSRVYVLPAWQLMTPANFGRPSESGWTLAV